MAEQCPSRLFPSPLPADDREKDWVPHRNSASSIYSGLSLSSRIKGHLLEAPPAPGPGSLTASNLHIQFAFQDFPHRGPTVRIPKPSRGESLDVFLPWGGRRPMMGRRKPMMGGLHAWFTPVLHGLNPCLLKGRMEEREKSPTILPSQKLKSQTTGKSFSDPAFQMGLSPDSFKFLPACLHLNSLQDSWICSPLLSNSSGHQMPPDSKSVNKFPWTHLFICTEQTCPSSGLHRIASSHPCCSLCVFSTSLLSLLSPWISGLP